MKKIPIFFILIISILPILICACGEDGDDGTSYIAIDWVSTPQSYWDDNPGIPYTFYAGQYYESSAGSYDFEYTAWDGSFWYGNYKITVDKGEDGELFSNGSDGEDRYFELWLYSSGPGFYVYEKVLEEKNIAIRKGIIVDDLSELNKEQLRNTSEIKGSDSEMKIAEKTQGRYTMKIMYQRILE